MIFPDYLDAPASLLATDGHCGLLAAWTVLRFFGKRTSADKLRLACRFTERDGVFAIGLAVALREHGLGVSFHTEDDPAPRAVERRLYGRARRLKVAIHPPLSLAAVIAVVSDDCLPVVLYQDKDDPHFSPVLGLRRGRVLLPLAESGSVSARALRVARREPGILQQTLLVRRDGPPNKR